MHLSSESSPLFRFPRKEKPTQCSDVSVLDIAPTDPAHSKSKREENKPSSSSFPSTRFPLVPLTLTCTRSNLSTSFPFFSPPSPTPASLCICGPFCRHR